MSVLASASRAIICWFSHCFLVLRKPKLFSYRNKKKKITKYYVPDPSSTRHYSDICHLKTFYPFLSFPSISEPGCRQGAHFPEQFPPGKRARPAAHPPVAEATDPPRQAVHHQRPRSKGWYPGLPSPHPPMSSLPPGGCRSSHQEGRSRHHGVPTAPVTGTWGPRSQPHHAALLTLVQI